MDEVPLSVLGPELGGELLRRPGVAPVDQREMEVFGGRGEGGVAEHLLECHQIGAALQAVGGEAVAQRMGGGLLANVGLFCYFPEHGPNAG